MAYNNSQLNKDINRLLLRFGYNRNISGMNIDTDHLRPKHDLICTFAKTKENLTKAEARSASAQKSFASERSRSNDILQEIDDAFRGEAALAIPVRKVVDWSNSVDISQFRVIPDMPLSQVHRLVHTMGLLILPVVDPHGVFCGLITKKMLLEHLHGVHTGRADVLPAYEEEEEDDEQDDQKERKRKGSSPKLLLSRQASSSLSRQKTPSRQDSNIDDDDDLEAQKNYGAAYRNNKLDRIEEDDSEQEDEVRAAIEAEANRLEAEVAPLLHSQSGRVSSRRSRPGSSRRLSNQERTV